MEPEYKKLTVRELIEVLQTFDGNLEVWAPNPDPWERPLSAFWLHTEDHEGKDVLVLAGTGE